MLMKWEHLFVYIMLGFFVIKIKLSVNFNYIKGYMIASIQGIS